MEENRNLEELEEQKRGRKILITCILLMCNGIAAAALLFLLLLGRGGSETRVEPTILMRTAVISRARQRSTLLWCRTRRMRRSKL